MNETFRVGKSHQIDFIVLVGFFSLFTCGPIAGIFFGHFGDNASDRIYTEVGLAVFAAGFAGLGIFVFFQVIYFAERVSFTDSQISIRYHFRELQFDPRAIDKIRWGASFNHRRILVCDKGRKIPFDLQYFSREDRLSIIRFLRHLIPESKQENWPLFCHYVALILRDGGSAIQRMRLATNYSPDNFVLITRKRYDKIFLVMVPLSLVIAIWLWRRFQWPQVFVLPFSLLFWYPLLRYSIPRTGSRQLKLGAKGQRAFICTSLFAITALLICASLARLHAQENILVGILVAVAFITMAAILYVARRSDLQMRRDHAIAAPLSAKQWDEGEAESPQSAL